MENTACAFCGHPQATKVGDRYICDDCYIARGSCCAEWFDENVPHSEQPVIEAPQKTRE
jgi:hypothetical protein